MPRWTNEQQEAIDKSGCNIIVSAGAGSGKTAVLSQRVLQKIESGIHVNELLILTFTKAAASEMKDRIRKKIASNPELKDELNLLNSSYITTFDSFALSIVKKNSVSAPPLVGPPSSIFVAVITPIKTSTCIIIILISLAISPVTIPTAERPKAPIPSATLVPEPCLCDTVPESIISPATPLE